MQSGMLKLNLKRFNYFSVFSLFFVCDFFVPLVFEQSIEINQYHCFIYELIILYYGAESPVTLIFFRIFSFADIIEKQFYSLNREQDFFQ